MEQVLSEDLSPMQKEQVASKMLEGKYIRKLLDIFRVTLLCPSRSHPVHGILSNVGLPRHLEMAKSDFVSFLPELR